MSLSTGPIYYVLSYLRNIVVVGPVDVWIGLLSRRTLSLGNNAPRRIRALCTPVENRGQGGEWKNKAMETRGELGGFPQFSTLAQVGVPRRISDVAHGLHHPLPKVRI
tara:strand:+ start:240 stop:563 length:324 start_codon:yes stop_codon:yes gene_type:complete